MATKISFFYLVLTLCLVTSCSYDKTNIELGSLFDPTWDLSKGLKLTLDENYVEIKNGQAQLKPLDLKDSGDDFVSGTFVGTKYSELNKSLNMILKTNLQLDVRNILPTRVGELLGYWKMDANFNDSSVNALPFIAFGDAAASGVPKIGSFSGTFDGSGDYLNLGDVDVFDNASELSACVWASHNTTSSDNYLFNNGINTGKGFLILRDDVGSDSGRTDIYTLLIADGSDASASKIEGATDSGQGGRWNHICFTYKQGELEGARLYVNGLEDANSPVSTVNIGNINTGTEPFFIASLNGSILLNGLLDEMAIWGTVLSQEEILKIYKTQSQVFAGDIELSEFWTPKYNNMIGYWKMDSHWQDSSTANNHAVASGDSSFSIDGQVGSHAGNFDGDGDFVTAVRLPQVTFATDFSISAWIRPNDSTGTTTGTLFQNSQSSNERIVVTQNNGHVHCGFYDGVSWKTFGGPAELGVWQHILCVKKGSVWTMYINGKAYTTTPASGRSYGGSASSLVFGGNSSPGNADYNGDLDELAVWDLALSFYDVWTIYNHQRQRYAGHYDSQVVNAGSVTSSWPSLGWSTNLPFGKEFVGDFDGDGSPDPEKVSNYPLVNNLELDLVGLWSLNEKIPNTGPSSFDFFDSSGNNHYGNLLGTLALNQSGKFLSSIYFDGVDGESVEVPHHADFDSEKGTISLWVFSDLTWGTDGGSGGGGQGAASLVSHGEVDAHPALVLSLTGGFVQLQGSDQFCGSPCNQVQFVSTNKLSANRWNHIVVTYDMNSGSTQNIFLNGVKTSYVATGDWSVGVGEKLIFGDFESGAGWYEELNGKMDEVIFWKRILSDDEIQSIYRRGVNRIKFQVKSCIDANCDCQSYSATPSGSANDCDGDSTPNSLDFNDIYKSEFTGPGGDGATFYSELFNRKSSDLIFNCGINSSDSDSSVCVNDEITFSAGPKPSAPTISYDSFPLLARPLSNPYFQYRAYFEADENTACEGAPCLPSLNSVSLNLDDVEKYHGAVQEISFDTPLSYQVLVSAGVEADDCVTFQLSPDGTNYYYFNSGNWAGVSETGHRSTKLDFEKNIVKFSQQFGPGLLYVKAFLQTNANQTSSCTLKSINVLSSKPM